ncbi:hypothetical protein JXJ21_22585 [candidate division KSB1 bacterium]|nr:hypothetical protein [candidate division KSB1 bacterium]
MRTLIRFLVLLIFALFSNLLYSQQELPVDVLGDLPLRDYDDFISGYTIANGNLYLFGGLIPGSSKDQAYDDIRTYNLQSGTWSTLSYKLPYEIHDGTASAAFFDNHFYLAPGLATGDVNGEGTHNKIIDVNLNNSSARGESVPFANSTRLWNVGKCLANGKVYFFGGWDGNPRSEIFEYNPADGTLNHVANMNVATNFVFAMPDNDGWIYYWGALHGETQSIERFHPTTYQVKDTGVKAPPVSPDLYWHISEENSIYFAEKGNNQAAILRYDYALSLVEPTGMVISGEFANRCLQDDMNPGIIFAFRRDTDSSKSLALCRISLDAGISGQPTLGYLHISSAILNAVELQPDDPMLMVKPNEAIGGQVWLKADNLHNATDTVPLAGTPGWDRHSTSYWGISPSLPYGFSEQNAGINLTAPADTGLYYIFFAFISEKSHSNVMSLTAWDYGSGDVWDDGFDVADWGENEARMALDSGFVMTPFLFPEGYQPRKIPATVIRVKVYNAEGMQAHTDPASNIGLTTATLNATVFPNNESTTVKFEYGTNSNNLDRALTASPNPVSAYITNLTPNTRYFYRLVVFASAVSHKCQVKEFTTGANAPYAKTESATRIAAGSAMLNGTVNPNGLETKKCKMQKNKSFKS